MTDPTSSTSPALAEVTHPVRGMSSRLQERLTVTTLALIALIFRLWNLQYPKGFVFDEVYYAQNAESLLHHGVELDPKTGAAQFIVHPPIGKWMIAAGIKLFGYHEFGWRISAALVGTASVILIYYVAKRLFDNYFLSLAAGILTLCDGMHLVMSRTALLDIFLMFFTLLGFFFLLRSSHWLAGISLGLASATKWSGAYYLLAYFLFTLYVDYRNNRAMEYENAARKTLREKLLLRATQYGVLPVFIYVASWVGWFANSSGWDRHYSKNIFKSWWYYQGQILDFHTHLTTPHTYSANPWSWLIMGRPTSFYYQAPNTCGAKLCSQEVLALGTPLLWWSGVIAIAITFGYWIARREWQSGLLLLSLAAGYLPWFEWQKRTVFTFYVIAFEPFIVLIIVYALAKFLESGRDGIISKRRTIASWIFLALIAANFLYFFPLFTGGVITYHHWSTMMWFPSWI
jgi:dolichyl-phosphate-mannose--protein O-mannosyl transferase